MYKLTLNNNDINKKLRCTMKQKVELK